MNIRRINSTLAFLFGLLALMTSCEKATPPIDYFPNWGEVSVLKNDNPELFRITGTVFTSNGQRFCNIYLNSKLDYTDRKEVWMDLLNLRPEVTKGDSVCIAYTNIFYPEPHSCAGTFLASIQGGDLIGDTYKPIFQENNYLVITDWDPENLIISGEFQVSYYFTGDQHIHDWMADTIRFTEGRFKTRLEDLDEK